MSEWLLLYVAFCTIMAISRQKEARRRDYALLFIVHSAIVWKCTARNQTFIKILWRGNATEYNGDRTQCLFYTESTLVRGCFNVCDVETILKERWFTVCVCFENPPPILASDLVHPISLQVPPNHFLSGWWADKLTRYYIIICLFVYI